MKRTLGALLLVTGLSLLGPTVLAQSGSGYELSWWTVDGGAREMSGGEYMLAGAVGQPDANTLTGGSYTLAGGFWGGGAVTIGYDVYLPLVLRNG